MYFRCRLSIQCAGTELQNVPAPWTRPTGGVALNGLERSLVHDFDQDERAGIELRLPNKRFVIPLEGSVNNFLGNLRDNDRRHHRIRLSTNRFQSLCKFSS